MAKATVTRELIITETEQTVLRKIFYAIESILDNEDIGDYPDDVYDILERFTRVDKNEDARIRMHDFDSSVILRVEEDEEEEE